MLNNLLLLFFSAVILLVAVCVYGVQYQYFDLTKDSTLHISFGLTVVAMVAYAINFFIALSGWEMTD